MHRSHRSNAAAHTPCVCDTPIRAVLLWLVVFVGHRPDNKGDNAQSVLTSSFLQHHNPAAQQQQQWAHLARIDDRTAAIKVDLSEVSIGHLTTPPPYHHYLSPCCFFCIMLCVVQHCHCSSCAQHCAPTAPTGSVICACGRSALYAQY